MKYFSILIFTVLFTLITHGQSLSPERVSKIKLSTVRVIVEGSISVGTGFFINNEGLLLTCWHVILPAFQNRKTTYIEFNNGDTIEVGIPTILNNDTSFGRKSVGYDFCILTPLRPIKTKFTFLKLGDFDATREGDEIYTCGYPLGFSQQFISKGIISTKYTNYNNGVTQFGKFYSLPRSEALLDITLNKGNSGGAIIKIGKTIEEDEVVGIADFIINPLGNKADSIIKALDPKTTKGYVTFNTFDSSGIISTQNPNEIATIFAKALSSTSIGVSGCVAVNHVYDFLKPRK